MDTIKKWVDEYADELYTWATYKVSDTETARDLVQDTFLAAVKGYDNFQGKSNPKTWLFSILNYKIIDHYRKNFKKAKVIADKQESKSTEITEGFFDTEDMWKNEYQPNSWTDTDNFIDDGEFREILKKCLDNLPEKWFTAVNLKYMEEKEGKQICQELEITPTNFWQIIRRAKLQLRRCLEVNWFNV